VTDVDTEVNFWKRAVVKTSTSAKNVEVRICKNYFQDFRLGKAARGAIHAQPEHVLLERAASDRKDIL